MNVVAEAVGKMLMIVALFVAVALLLNFPVMWLMNCVFAPSALMAVFGVAHMTFWKTFAFSAFLGLLCGMRAKNKED
jgi:hypothetical protein